MGAMFSRDDKIASLVKNSPLSGECGHVMHKVRWSDTVTVGLHDKEE